MNLIELMILGVTVAWLLVQHHLEAHYRKLRLLVWVRLLAPTGAYIGLGLLLHQGSLFGIGLVTLLCTVFLRIVCRRSWKLLFRKRIIALTEANFDQIVLGAKDVLVILVLNVALREGSREELNAFFLYLAEYAWEVGRTIKPQFKPTFASIEGRADFLLFKLPLPPDILLTQLIDWGGALILKDGALYKMFVGLPKM